MFRFRRLSLRQSVVAVMAFSVLVQRRTTLAAESDYRHYRRLLGWLLGIRFQSLITNIDHWIAFVLLAVIGANMIKESFSKEEECPDASFGFKTMLTLAVATSIDALAVGVTFAFLDVAIVPAVLLIGATTFVCSAVGVKIGNVFGNRFQSKAEFLGGLVLIAIGLKILIEHLFFGG